MTEKLTYYIVLGAYLDGDVPSRFASGYYAPSPIAAEKMALEEYDPDGENWLLIAGVVTGEDVRVVG